MLPNAYSHPREERTLECRDVQLPVVVRGQGSRESCTWVVGAMEGEARGGLRPPDPVRGKGRVGLQLIPQQQLLNNHFPLSL